MPPSLEWYPTLDGGSSELPMPLRASAAQHHENSRHQRATARSHARTLAQKHRSTRRTRHGCPHSPCDTDSKRALESISPPPHSAAPTPVSFRGRVPALAARTSANRQWCHSERLHRDSRRERASRATGAPATARSSDAPPALARPYMRSRVPEPDHTAGTTTTTTAAASDSPRKHRDPNRQLQRQPKARK
jgi:hypothetical protein